MSKKIKLFIVVLGSFYSCAVASDPNVRLLLTAVQMGLEDVVSSLIVAGVDVNQAQEDGVTPLYIAAGDGHAPLVKLLLSAGADSNKIADHGGTPLDISVQEGHEGVVKLLLDAGGDPNRARYNGATLLYMAVQQQHKGVVNLLLKAGASPNRARNDGATPLHVAASIGHKGLVKQLLDAGAEIDLITREGAKPLDYARAGRYSAIVELFQTIIHTRAMAYKKSLASKKIGLGLNEAEKLESCPICHLPYKSLPVVLHALLASEGGRVEAEHTVCASCLLKILGPVVPKCNTIHCPVCRVLLQKASLRTVLEWLSYLEQECTIL